MEKYENQLNALAQMSNKYGADPAYVLAGGGNTSFKTAQTIWVKGSGTSLATIKAEDFVVLEREKLCAMWENSYPDNEKQREAAVLADMMAARVAGEQRRPSVETLLHDLFPQKYVLHVHPAIVNGLTCSKDGQSAMQRLFPNAVWVAGCKPGYILARECRIKMQEYKAVTGNDCSLLFLQNHGIFFAADTVEEIDAIASHVMGALEEEVEAAKSKKADVQNLSRLFAKLYGDTAQATVHFTVNNDILAYDPATKSLTPDHIVYAKAKQLALPKGVTLQQAEEAFAAFTAQNGYKPKIIFVDGLGMFACGMNEKEASTAQIIMLDAIKVVNYAEAFGGVSPMSDALIDFIVDWEVESYRSKVSLGGK